jgi:hypothetical protein
MVKYRKIIYFFRIYFLKIYFKKKKFIFLKFIFFKKKIIFQQTNGTMLILYMKKVSYPVYYFEDLHEVSPWCQYINRAKLTFVEGLHSQLTSHERKTKLWKKIKH